LWTHFDEISKSDSTWDWIKSANFEHRRLYGAFWFLYVRSYCMTYSYQTGLGLLSKAREGSSWPTRTLPCLW